MQYLYILGRQPEFGLAELEAILGGSQIEPAGTHALGTQELDVNHLGGTLKIGRIILTTTSQAPPPALPELIDLQPGKNTVGLSIYGSRVKPPEVARVAMQLKKSAAGRSLRMVLPSGGRTHLSVAQAKFNHLPSKGYELLVVHLAEQTIYALTSQIEDIDRYSKRDFERPARDARVGMLPPKLAQIIINTSGPGGIYDPFCGTGVILQEALLMGRDAYGSDIEAKMIQASERNLDWLARQFELKKTFQLFQADAAIATIPKGASIASEGYLGPNFSTLPKAKHLRSVVDEVSDLYLRVLRNFARQQTSGKRLSLAVPAWFGLQHYHHLPLIDHLEEMGYTFMDFEHVNTRQLIYRRPGQTTGRQLLILRKS